MRKIVLLLIIGGVVMATLQERIKERRLASGFTLLEVAEMLGVKEATMQRYESGEIKNIKHETIIKMAKIFNCTPQYLMGWSDMQFEPKSIEDANIFFQPNLFHNESQVALIGFYKILNDTGKKKLLSYAEDLVQIKEYTKKEPCTNTPSVRAARSFGDKSKIDRNADIDEQRFIDAPESDIDM